MNFNHYLGSDVGQKRKANEDFHGDRMTVNGYVFVVCDGMGGHVGGATASQLAVQSILEFFDKEPLDNIILGIDKAIKFANEQIFATALAQPELKGMGTTATVTVMREEGAYIGHVGDSRIYLKSDGKLNRLTKDHSFVQGLVDQGIIKDEEAESHPQKNQILKALGIREDVDATVCESPIQLKVGDTILMCSDGLSGLVKDARMEELVNENNVQQSAVDLINEANQNGGDDNITAAVISITESPYTVSVFKNYNPVGFTGTQTVDVSEEVQISPKWYQNTKLMLILGGSAFVIIAFLTVVFWPTDEVDNEDNLVNNENLKEVNIVNDTITDINPQKLQELKKNGTILVLEKGDTLTDGKYHCEGFDVELKDGKISSLKSVNVNVQTRTNVNNSSSSNNRRGNSANRNSNSTDESSTNLTSNTNSEEETENQDKFLEDTPDKGQGWAGFINKIKCNCTRDSILSWNPQFKGDTVLKAEPYKYKILK